MTHAQSIQGVLCRGWASDRLSYRALEDNDADRSFLHENIAGDPALWALYSGSNCDFRPQSSTMTQDMLKRFTTGTLAVMICLRTSDESDTNGQSASPELGTSIGIVTLNPDLGSSLHHRSSTLGIAIVGAHQNQGYGPEALSWVLDWAFKFGGQHRVGLYCYSYNDRAQRAYERLGFVKEGTLRENIWFNGAWYDTICYGMLETDWDRLRPQGIDVAQSEKNGFMKNGVVDAD
jgi:RimJ/RimL family protein N-acetyltransferase